MSPSELSVRKILKTWWPLAASWLLMSAELPALVATMARLPDPKVNLAAYGGVVFPLALIIEAPIIMLLAASTALSKDWASYQLIRRFMMTAGALLTGIHILVALTPLYYLIVNQIIGVPPEIVAPARIGLILMIPWTWSIAYRRFNQGVLIRFGHSETVGIGTVIRLTADVLVLLAGYWLGSVSGIVVGTVAVSAGVISEAIYVGIVVRPVIRRQLKPAPPLEQPLTWRGFYDFYIPLAMTSLIFVLALPIGSAALSRMPLALASLAVWPALSGLTFMFRSAGIAYNEVVVALLDYPRSYRNLYRVTIWLAAIFSLMLLLVAATPISTLWFSRISALSPDLLRLAQTGLWLALPMPAMAVLQSWYQGGLLHGRRTRGVTEAVIIYMVSSAITLSVGVSMGRFAGVYVGVASMGISMGLQTIWLWLRSRPALHAARRRDEGIEAEGLLQAEEVFAGTSPSSD
jgi:hypothetical protein